MVANINSMMYVGKDGIPWHGLGTKVESAQTSADAINSAGLNWTVSRRPVTFQHNGQAVEIPGKYAVVRDDNARALGIVGNVYRELQNKEAFSFFDAIVGVKEAMYHTAGALGEGERIWLLAKLPGYVRTMGDDVTEKYLLLSNSHDGTSAINVMFTPIRVVCQNTLNMAIGSATNRVKVRHTINASLRIDQIREDLGIVNKRFALLEEISAQMAKTPFKSSDLKNLVVKSGLIPDTEKDSTRAANILEEVSRLFEIGKGADMPSAKGTAWGAVNAVIEYVDHRRGTDIEKRASSLLFGSGADIKQKAWNQVLTLTK